MKTDAAARLAASRLLDAAIAKLHEARTAILTGDADDAEVATTDAIERSKDAAAVIEGVVDAVWCAEHYEELV